MNQTAKDHLHQLLVKQDRANDLVDEVDAELSQWCDDNPGIDFESLFVEYLAVRDAQ